AAIGKFSHAQEEDKIGKKKGFDKSKLFIGGNFGMTFGDYTLINVSPQLGYRFNQYLAAGAGINFQYVSLKERDYYTGDPIDRISQEVIGMNIFGRVYPFRQLMLQAQPELNYIFGKIKYYNPPSKTNLDAAIVPSLLLGGGVVFPAGNGGFIVSIFYDVLQKPNSPYSDKPFFNFGYNVGF
ncbi:MAG TPA: hypothetical protein VHD35_04300, partial [Chitinophagaceae bacterium]|nr:hypothetical protein [Chitinophagaceae bacterium]